METRNNNRPLSSQTSSQRLYEDDHEEISRICRETGRKPAEEVRDLVSEAMRSRRNPPPAANEIMQTLQQLVEQNRLANERYERLIEKYERLEEQNSSLKQGLIQNLREFYAILLETLSASIGARRLAWNYVAYTVLKQSGSTDEQIKQRYEAEKKAWIDEKDNIADALEEAIKKMPLQS
jgi:hypothetical protein